MLVGADGELDGGDILQRELSEVDLAGLTVGERDAVVEHASVLGPLKGKLNKS